MVFSSHLYFDGDILGLCHAILFALQQGRPEIKTASLRRRKNVNGCGAQLRDWRRTQQHPLASGKKVRGAEFAASISALRMTCLDRKRWRATRPGIEREQTAATS
jgi:hypothetical protein